MELLRSLFFITMLIFTSSYPQPAISRPHNNFTDLESLLNFKAHVMDPYGILATNWTTTTSFCGWVGIHCNRRQRVTAINIQSLSLEGTISPHISNLSFLSYLNLANNSLTGSIPEALGWLPRLTDIILGHNILSGPIPSTILNMSSLIELSIIFNALSGSLLSNNSFIMIPHVQYLSLSSNHFSGDFSSFTRCRNLRKLSLSMNHFSGIIPAEIGSLPELRILYLGDNQLSGTIPTSLGNVTKLIGLTLESNNLTGVIPEELGNLPKLQYLSLSNCTLTGSIPSALLNDSMLYHVDLSNNKLSGSVPVEIGKSLQLLIVLYLGGNQLTGGLEFLSSLSNCKDLETIGIWQNKLEGVLPGSIGNFSMHMQTFHAYGNYIKGKIPAGLGNLSGLINLSLNENELTGTIPSALARMEALQAMRLSFNGISGLIPFELGLMENLNILALGKNFLSGSIPPSLANISRIQYLYLDNNNLSSSIPQKLWTLENLLELNLSMNNLNGSLPPQVGSLKGLVTIDLSMNQLSGNVVDAFGELQALQHLDLSKNLLKGPIPKQFGGLISITYLNLSHNFLSGDIPESFANLSYLDNLDLSFNRLEGQIPRGGVFSNLSISSLMGNEALCGALLISFPPCPPNVALDNSGRKLQLVKYILPATAFGVILTCLCLVYTFNWRRKVKSLSNTDATYLDDHRMISHHELVRATANFSQANLLGRGCFGSVFRGCLADGLIIAVKVFNLEVEGALKSFNAECQVLRTVRHRNLVKIISVCSNLDFKALILQLMPKGSLEQWLPCGNYYLNLLQRLNIMVDVSLALEYLHHHHPHVVLHCDLKPANVLLDEEMVAHVSDFGIAKLMLGDGKSVASASTPGTIGYIAPEFAITGTLSKASDIYSF